MLDRGVPTIRLVYHHTLPQMATGKATNVGALKTAGLKGGILSRIKGIICATIIIFASGFSAKAQSAAPADQSPDFRTQLLQNTPLVLMVLNEVSTKTAKPGDVIKLRLTVPVLIDGRIILPEGAAAFGEVVEVKGSAPALKAGTLSARLTHLDLDSQRIEISGDLSTTGKGGKSDDALKLLMVPFYAPFAPGNNAKLKAGDIVRGVVAQGYDVEIAAEHGASPKFKAATDNASTSTVQVNR